MDKVKCADCGFLGARHRDIRELLGAELPLRVSGELPSVDNRGYLYDEWPVCLARAIDFRRALNDNSGTPHRKQVINAERECAHFTPWIQGLTPKEHLERQEAEARLRWQERREQEDRDWREAQEEKAGARHREALAAASRTSLISALIGFVAALAAAALTYLLTQELVR